MWDWLLRVGFEMVEMVETLEVWLDGFESGGFEFVGFWLGMMALGFELVVDMAGLVVELKLAILEKLLKNCKMIGDMNWIGIC